MSLEDCDHRSGTVKKNLTHSRQEFAMSLLFL